MSKQITKPQSAPQPLKAGQKQVVQITKGQHLRVQDVLDGAARDASNVVATKQAKDLKLKFADGTELQFENFYEECAGNACSVTLAGKDAAGYAISGDSAVGAATQDGSQLAYAYGDQATLMTMASADTGMSTALGALGEGTVFYIPTAAQSAGGVGMLGLVGGGLGLAAAAGGGGGAAAAAAAAIIPEVLSSVLSGVVMMGPVVNGNDLTVTVYRADGTILTSGSVNADGTFKIVISNYTGAVLVRVNDANDTIPDYIDETTRQPKDLSVDLRAATNIPAPGEYNLAINMLTELAVREMGLPGGSAGSSTFALNTISTDAGQLVAAINTANNNVAEAFGLAGQDLVRGTEPVPVINLDGSTNTSANDYGRVLAGLSGAEKNSTTEAVLKAFSDNLTGNVLSAEAIKVLVDGSVNAGVTITAATANLINGLQVLIADLQAQITSNDGDIAALISDAKGTFGQAGYVAPTTASLAGLKAVLDVLDTAASEAFDELEKAIGAPTLYEADGTTVKTAATGLYKAIENSISTAISALEQKIQGEGVDAEDFTTLAALKALIGEENTAAEGEESNATGLYALIGSGAANVAAEIGQANTAAEGEESNATGLYLVIETSISTAISALEQKIQGEGVTEEDFTTLAALKALIGAANTAAEGEESNASGLYALIGSSAGNLAAAVGLPAAENNGTATGIYALIADLQSQIDDIVKPDLIQANELDNRIELYSYDGKSTFIRAELYEGNDYINSFSGAEEIVGGAGADTINLTYKDTSNDTVIYQSIYDGKALPIVTVDFPAVDGEGDFDYYRAGTVLSIRVNNTVVSYTVTEGLTAQDAVAGLATAIENHKDLGAVTASAEGSTLRIVGVDGMRLNVQPLKLDGDEISNPGLASQVVLTFSADPADYPQGKSLGGTFVFDREITVTINGMPVTAAIAYDLTTQQPDPAATMANIKAAIEAQMQGEGDFAGVLASVTLDGMVLTLVGKTAPGAEPAVFTVDSVEVSDVGEQQQTTVSFSSNAADYYAGGKLSVTVAGQPIEADMVAGDAAASVQNLLNAVKSFVPEPGSAFDGLLETVEQGAQIISGGTVSAQQIQGTGDSTYTISSAPFYVLLSVNGVGINAPIEVTVAAEGGQTGLYKIDAALPRVVGLNGKEYAKFDSIEDFAAALKLNGTGAPLSTALNVTFPEPGVMRLSGGFGAQDLDLGEVDLQPNLTLTAATEAADPIDATASMTFAGEAQHATIDLDDAAFYTDRLDGTDAGEREVPVYFKGGKVYVTIDNVDRSELSTISSSQDVKLSLANGETLSAYLARGGVASELVIGDNGNNYVTYQDHLDSKLIAFSLSGSKSFDVQTDGDKIVLPYVAGGKSYFFLLDASGGASYDDVLVNIFATDLGVDAPALLGFFDASQGTTTIETFEGFEIGTSDGAATLAEGERLEFSFSVLEDTSVVSYAYSFTYSPETGGAYTLTTTTTAAGEAPVRSATSGNLAPHDATADGFAAQIAAVLDAALGASNIGVSVGTEGAGQRSISFDISLAEGAALRLDVAPYLATGAAVTIEAPMVPGSGTDAYTSTITISGDPSPAEAPFIADSTFAFKPGFVPYDPQLIELVIGGKKFNTADFATYLDTQTLKVLTNSVSSTATFSDLVAWLNTLSGVDIAQMTGNVIDIKYLPGVVGEITDLYINRFNPEVSNNLWGSGFYIGAVSNALPGSGVETTTQALVDAINAQTGEGGSLFGLVALDGASVDDFGVITLTSATLGKESFRVSDVRMDYQGIKQIATVDFSEINNYDGGDLSLTIQGVGDGALPITITQEMLGDKAATIAALKAQIQTEIDGKYVTSPATLAVISDSDPNFDPERALKYDAEFPGYFNSAVQISLGGVDVVNFVYVHKPGDTLADLIAAINAEINAQAGEGVTPDVRVELLVDPANEARSLVVVTSENPESALFVQIDYQFDGGGGVVTAQTKGTASPIPGSTEFVPGSLAGIVGEVVEVNGVFTLVSTDKVGQQFSITDATTDDPVGEAQVTTVSLNESAPNGTGTYMLTVEGETFTGTDATELATAITTFLADQANSAANIVANVAKVEVVEGDLVITGKGREAGFPTFSVVTPTELVQTPDDANSVHQEVTATFSSGWLTSLTTDEVVTFVFGDEQKTVDVTITAEATTNAAKLALLTAALDGSPLSGATLIGNTITITASGFAPNELGQVSFDVNGAYTGTFKVLRDGVELAGSAFAVDETLAGYTAPTIDTNEIAGDVFTSNAVQDDMDVLVTVVNPGSGIGGNPGFYGDAPLAGSEGEGGLTGQGVQQVYTNPEELNTLYGSNAGYYSQDGLYTSYLSGGTPGVADNKGNALYTERDVINTNDEVNIGEAPTEDVLFASGEDGVRTTTRDGFEAYGFDVMAADIDTVTLGSAGSDVIWNFQVGGWAGEDYVGDTIALEGALLESTHEGEVTVLQAEVQFLEEPVTSAAPYGYLNQQGEQFLGWQWGTVSLDTSDITGAFTIVTDPNLSIRKFDSADGYGVNVSLGLQGMEFESVDALGQYYVDWLNTRFSDANAASYEVVGGDLQVSLSLAYQFNGSSVGLEASYMQSTQIKQAFDLSSDEYAVIASAHSALSASAVDDADEVATLLSGLFDFNASANNELNTSIFAVTATGDPSVTAIWTHQQSSDTDATVGVNELHLLAMVNTLPGVTGEEFGWQNFQGATLVMPPV